MKKFWMTAITGLLTLAILLPLLPLSASAESSAQIQQRLEALKAEKADIDARLAGLDSDIDTNFSQIEAIVALKDRVNQEIFLLTQQTININNQISEYRLLVAEKQDELDTAQSHLDALQADSKERIRAMEKNGKISYWSVLFRANSFTDFLDRLQMIEQIADADIAKLRELADAAEAVERAAAALEAELTQLEQTSAELAAAQETLKEKRAESDALLADLVSRGLEYEQLLEAAEAEIAALETQIANAEQDYQDAKADEWAAAHPGQSGGSTTPSPDMPNNAGWIVPCNYSVFTSAFGYRDHPIYGGNRFHYGVDLAGSTGTPIYAARSGTIREATRNSSAGYYVSIDHGDGYRSIYMHMTHYIVYPGQYVEQGQVIGYMGDTGASKGTHLHFGISYNGSYVNPANYINI